MNQGSKGRGARWTAALAAASLALGCAQAQAAGGGEGADARPGGVSFAADAASAPVQRAFVPREVIVRYEPGAGELRAAARSAVAARGARRLPLARTQVLELARGTGVRAAVAELEGLPGVAWAEPNYVLEVLATPNDELFELLWGMHNTGQPFLTSGDSEVRGTPDADIDAPEAWEHTTGDEDVVVAVVDTGVAMWHPDFKQRIWRNPDEVLDGEDNDGNGLVDDVNGWDFVGDGSGNGDPIPDDPDGHGTHVAGTIAARGNDGYGVPGVAWDARIMPLRVADEFGRATTERIAAAFVYAAQHGADVVNTSLGGPLAEGETVEANVIADAVAASPETLHVVAAGNGGEDFQGDDNDVTPVLPCSIPHPNLICVAATDEHDELTQFSNYGAESVDLAAPGRRVLSTLPFEPLLGPELFERDVFASAPVWTHGTLGPGGPDTWGSFERGAENLALADSPDGDYEPSTNSYAAGPRLDFSGRRDCAIRFTVGLDMDADVPPAPQSLFVEGDLALVELAFDSPDSEDSLYVPLWGKQEVRYYVPLPDEELEGEQDVYLRLALWSDADSVVDDGAWFDDLLVQCRANAFAYLSGTSMATPHVAGVAALLRSWLPDASVAELRRALLDGVDALPDLAGKVASGGRLNAYGALRELDRRALTTTIAKAPRKRVVTRKRKARVRFVFRPRVQAELQCKLDKRRWRPCPSRARFKVGKGRHRLRVRATRGLAPGPVAQHEFVVKRKRAGKRRR